MKSVSAADVRKKLPIGIEDFQQIREDGFYYVDKTAMIRDLLNDWGKVNLFTRPRRFGKSLNMSMLKAFFEIGSDKSLFEGLAISEEKALCEAYMGKFPVISISLKSVNGRDYESACSILRSVIGDEARRFETLLTESERLTETDKVLYRQLITPDLNGDGNYTMSEATLKGSLKLLSSLLCKHYEKKVLILIDEYDVPLSKANDRGYYDQMVDMIRGIFDLALKTNESLYFAVMTGCLRVAKESIFTGLNNLRVLSISTAGFNEYFGFTDPEVRAMLKYYNLAEKYEEVREWYDGYRFGNADIYCPWDVISYCAELRMDPTASPKDYWSNTSGNDAVRHFIEMTGSGVTKGEIESLIAGETVTKEIYEDLTYNRLYDSIDNIWSLLFTTGYLTQCGRPEGKRYQLAIPNREIRNIFTDQIMKMFKENVPKDGERLNAFCRALQNGDAAEVERQFNAYLKQTISIRDTFVRKPTKENFYHGILLGILGYKSDWYVKSNRESGEGFSDICIRIEDEDTGIIIETKYARNALYDAACQEALSQIESLHYTDELREEGYHTIYRYGIACYKKKCKVVCVKENAGIDG
ncbi:MAG: ATP-binding protein [Lachnospiraceae bacterium]|nr:ATP-binding protein [Lachnospiraceae bacterium]